MVVHDDVISGRRRKFGTGRVTGSDAVELPKYHRSVVKMGTVGGDRWATIGRTVGRAFGRRRPFGGRWATVEFLGGPLGGGRTVGRAVG